MMAWSLLAIFSINFIASSGVFNEYIQLNRLAEPMGGNLSE